MDGASTEVVQVGNVAEIKGEAVPAIGQERVYSIAELLGVRRLHWTLRSDDALPTMVHKDRFHCHPPPQQHQPETPNRGLTWQDIARILISDCEISAISMIG